MSLLGPLRLAEADLLTTLAREARGGCIVEIGSMRGKSTVALALGSKQGQGLPVFAIDPHEAYITDTGDQYIGPPDRAAFMSSISSMGFADIVRLVNLSSEVVCAGWHEPVCLLWIDGDHAAESVRRDLRCWESFLIPGAPVAFHDSLDTKFGVHIVIKEALASGRYRFDRVEDRTTVLRVVRRSRFPRLTRILNRYYAISFRR